MRAALCAGVTHFGAPEGQCGVVAPFLVPALGPMATGRRSILLPRLRTISYWYGDACRVKSSAYVPLRASSSECVPDSTTDPSRNT